MKTIMIMIGILVGLTSSSFGATIGLSKSVTLNSGATVSFWKISSVKVEPIQMNETIYVSGYVNQSIANAKGPALKVDSITLPLTSDQLSSDPIQTAYTILTSYISAHQSDLTKPYFLNKTILSDLSGATTLTQ